MRLTIAARNSELAKLQAYTVADRLKAKFEDCEIKFQFKESLGDKNLSDPLWKMPSKGVFTDDFLQDLLKDRVDMVVHSWKDLPYEANGQTEVAATLEREDVRDILLLKKSSRDKLRSPQKLKILTSSPRRAYNLQTFLKDYLPFSNHEIEFEPVRGNVPTRMLKLIEHRDADGLVVAKAALDRLLAFDHPEYREVQHRLGRILAGVNWMILPLSANPAAPSQGALAIEILSARSDLKKMLEQINHQDTMECVQLERKMAAEMGGGCHQKLGITVLTKSFGRVQFLRGMRESGEVINQRGRVDPMSIAKRVWIANSSQFFERKRVEAEVPAQIDALFVAHSEAWVPGFDDNRVVWTAGMKTWRALAEMGVWVNGCQEGLGEAEDMRLGSLAPHLQWAKLSHHLGFSSNDKANIITYELRPKQDPEPIPEDYEAYYWKSASLFDGIIAKQPELRNKKHYCGPGHTLKELRRLSIGAQVVWPFEGDVD